MKRYLLPGLLLAFLLSVGDVPRAAAQNFPAPDTSGGRYYQPIFAGVTVTRDVVYGNAPTFQGAAQTLLLDVYEPAGDAEARRPLLIFAHQGGFLAGTRADPYMVAICTRMARLGYVAASIEYRLGFPLTGFAQPADTPGVARAAIRATQDLRAAVRFFRQDAATSRAYRIHPNYIMVGGSSAGAFAALAVGYLDKPGEVPAYVDLPSLGGLEGSGGNPGFSSAVAAVLNLSGATESPSLIEAGNAPLCSVHGTRDLTVPYLQGRIGSLLPPKYVFGSGRLHPRATAVGVRNTLRTLRGVGHVPFESNAAYADTTFWTLRDFLRPVLRLSGTLLAARPAASAASVAQTYPLPADDEVRLDLPPAWPALGPADLCDATGRVVPAGATLRLPRAGLPAGVYFLRFSGQPAVRVVWL